MVARGNYTSNLVSHALDASATAGTHPRPRGGDHFLHVQLRALHQGFFSSHHLGRVLEISTFWDMYFGLQHIGLVLLLFDFACSTPTGLVFLSPLNAPKVTLGAALSIPSPFSAFLPSSKDVTNATLSAAPSSLPKPNVTTLPTYVTYKVRNTEVTLGLHSFGSILSRHDVLFTIAPAVSKVLRYAIIGQGGSPILLGYFRYTHEFKSGNITCISVGDFREMGHPMSWDILADTLKGISDFMREADQRYTEVSFEVEQEGIGDVGSGRLELISSPLSNLL